MFPKNFYRENTFYLQLLPPPQKKNQPVETYGRAEQPKYRSLDCNNGPTQKAPFVVNTTIELKIVTAAYDNTGTPVS